jgi:hypothetical protein
MVPGTIPRALIWPQAVSDTCLQMCGNVEDLLECKRGIDAHTSYRRVYAVYQVITKAIDFFGFLLTKCLQLLESGCGLAAQQSPWFSDCAYGYKSSTCTWTHGSSCNCISRGTSRFRLRNYLFLFEDLCVGCNVHYQIYPL